MVKAVFLDVDNTLLDFEKCSIAAMRQGFEELGLTYTDKVYETFLPINVGLWQAMERGEITQQDIFDTRWGKIFAVLGIEADGIDFEARFRRGLHEGAELVEGAPEILACLSERYPLYVVSNGPQHQQEYRLEKAGLRKWLTRVFTSEWAGANKPERAFFERCFAELPGLDPADCMIVGDSLTADIAGGAAFGMQTCWFNFKSVPVPEDLQADHWVGSLAELKNVL